MVTPNTLVEYADSLKSSTDSEWEKFRRDIAAQRAARIMPELSETTDDVTVSWQHFQQSGLVEQILNGGQ
jgi:hypothetical protein